MKKREMRLFYGVILAVLLLAGCAKAEPESHVHTWENRKCTGCGEEKQVLQLGNWKYVLWEETGTMEITAFLEDAEQVPFRDLPEGCSKLQIGSGITAIPKDAFYGCKNLESVTIPKTVRSIGDLAFGQCESLTQVVFPEGLTSIGDQAFLMCKSLSEVQIPDSLTSMGIDPFRNTPAEIRISKGNPAFSVVDGVLFDKTCTRLIFCPCNKTGAYRIPQGVTEIGAYAFDQCNSLDYVTIPDSVDTIVGNPFAYAGLELELSRDNPNFSLADGVLFDKTGTRLIACPQGVPEETYEIPEGTFSIGEMAFAGCGKGTVTIPRSVTHIAPDAFWNCEGLRLYVWDGSYAKQYCLDQKQRFFYILPESGSEIDESDVPDGACP